MATAWAGRSSWDGRWASSCASSKATWAAASADGSGLGSGCSSTTTWTSWRRRTSSTTCPRSGRWPAHLPTDRRIVVERFRDELGDWRVVMLTPFGGRVHAPWALAIESRLEERLGGGAQTIWSDDGIAIRLPESEAGRRGARRVARQPARRAASATCSSPRRRRSRTWWSAGWGRSAMFAARFRENAARALLLPRRRPGSRTPLWQQRQRSAGLLAVASRYGSFPIIVETYRECLADLFDLPGTARSARGSGAARDRGPGRRDGRGLAVRRLAALRLSRRLHVRGRRAAGGAAGRRPGPGPRAAARAARARRSCAT